VVVAVVVNLLLNFAWSVLFFTLRRPVQVQVQVQVQVRERARGAKVPRRWVHHHRHHHRRP
jgi:hypothetical protein